jgi:hypothetical protein
MWGRGFGSIIFFACLHTTNASKYRPHTSELSSKLFILKKWHRTIKMSLKIYGNPISTCTQRVLFTLEEVGASYELSLIDMQKGQHKVRSSKPLRCYSPS